MSRQQPASGVLGAIDAVLPWLTVAALAASMYAVFVWVPNDAFQGLVQRIFYVHMAMWLPTFTAFGIIAVTSLIFLWKRRPFWDRLGRSSAELGLLFCTLGLATGSIWARPIWGIWWTWDPRLTLTLILWMLYAAYLLLRTLTTDKDQGAVFAAILGVTGVVNLYLINRAVYWWRSIHPAVIVDQKGNSGLADPTMQWTLTITLVAFFLLFLYLLRVRMQIAAMEEDVDELREQMVAAR